MSKDYLNVARKNMDQTMPTMIHVSWSKLLGARLRYQQEFCRKFSPTEQM